MKNIDDLIRIALSTAPEAPQAMNDSFIKDFSARSAHRSIKPKLVASAAIPLALAIAGTGAYAGSKSGFFRDKTTILGTITGETYENATDEIDFSLSYSADTIKVKLVFTEPDIMPYKILETVKLDDFSITAQSDDSEIVCGDITSAAINNGTAELLIPVGELKTGSYSFVLNSVIGEKKAEQPLKISGSWSAGFEVQ